MLSSMNPAFMTFRTFDPPFQLQIVVRQIKFRAPDKQPGFKTLHHLADMLRDGIRGCLKFCG